MGVPNAMYRDLHDTLQIVERAQSHLTNAILGNDTPTMTNESAAAQALTNEALRALKGHLSSSPGGATQTSRTMVQSALASLNDAWNDEEKVALADDSSEMRARALIAKTSIDYSAAYLRAAHGHQDGTR